MPADGQIFWPSITGQLNQPSAPSSVGSGDVPNRKLFPLRRIVFSLATGPVVSNSARSVGQPLMRYAVTPLLSLASTTSVVHDSCFEMTFSASGSNRLIVTAYVHFEPRASGRGSAVIISCIDSCFFFGGLLQPPTATTVPARTA